MKRSKRISIELLLKELSRCHMSFVEVTEGGKHKEHRLRVYSAGVHPKNRADKFFKTISFVGYNDYNPGD